MRKVMHEATKHWGIQVSESSTSEGSNEEAARSERVGQSEAWTSSSASRKHRQYLRGTVSQASGACGNWRWRVAGGVDHGLGPSRVVKRKGFVVPCQECCVGCAVVTCSALRLCGRAPLAKVWRMVAPVSALQLLRGKQGKARPAIPYCTSRPDTKLLCSNRCCQPKPQPLQVLQARQAVSSPQGFPAAVPAAQALSAQLPAQHVQQARRKALRGSKGLIRALRGSIRLYKALDRV